MDPNAMDPLAKIVVVPTSLGNDNPLDEGLLRAAHHGDLDEAKKLLEKGARLTAIAMGVGETLLHLAAKKGRKEMVSFLLERKSAINAKDEHQQTALHLATKSRHGEVVSFLLEKNTPIDAKDEYEQTVLHLAAKDGQRELVTFLLEKRAHIEAKDDHEQTALHLAVAKGHREVAALLLQSRADLLAKDTETRTDQRQNEGLKLPKNMEQCRPLSLSINGSLGADTLLWCITEQELWSLPLLLGIIQCDSQDSIVKILEMWPQPAHVPDPNFWAIYFASTELTRARIQERLRVVLADDLYTGTTQKNMLVMCGTGDDIADQNLYWAQEVRVTLKHLPGICGMDSINEDFLRNLAESPHGVIFETDVIQGMVLAAWQQYRGLTLLETAACLLSVTCLCAASYGFRHGFVLAIPSLYVVAVLHLKKTLDEFFQAFRYLIQCLNSSAQRSYMTFDNAADFLYMVAGWLAIVRQLRIGSEELEKPCMAPAVVQPAWRNLDGTQTASHSLSHPRHFRLLLADNSVSFSICTRILQLANPRRTRSNICSSHAGGEVGNLWRLRPL